MLRHLLFILFGVICFRASAQDNTRAFYYNIHDGVQAKVTIVPFEPRMLISDLHRDMCIKNGMTTQEVKYALAGGFCHALRISAPDRTESDIFGWEDEWPEALEEYYKKVGYKYQPIPAMTDQAAEIHGSRVIGGEIQQFEDTITRYMSAVIDRGLMQQLAAQTNSDYTLVISEVDIVNLGTPIKINPAGAAFFVRIHYDMYNADGTHRTGGVVKRPLNDYDYDPIIFSREEFIEAAKGLYDALSLSVVEEEEGPKSSGK